MYQALYRKYRPVNFKNVVGQKIVVKTLCNAILNNQINHAYLFCGPRGTGKTSIAKIFAKTINCYNLNDINPCEKCDSCLQINNNQSIDIIEIDAASNNGVDEIRELKNNVNLVPSIGKYKVYIIDEVHMLTTSAFNALLKTLEEPPKHVIFILATTEVHKIPQTVLSRCQKFEFKKINTNDIISRLEYICNIEKINFEVNAIKKIADISNGGMRDAISLLDQIRSYSDNQIQEKDVDEINGNISNEQMYDIINMMFKKKYTELIKMFEMFDNSGKKLIVILDSVLLCLKNILIYANDADYFDNENEINAFEKIIANVDDQEIFRLIDIILDTIQKIKYSNNELLVIQLMFIKMKNVNYNKEINKEEITNSNKLQNNTPTTKKNNDSNNKMNIIKKIRIGNTLCNFNKKDTLKFKSKLENVKSMLDNSKYSSTSSLILDGDLKAKGNNYLLFVYDSSNLSDMFNSLISDIEDMFKNLFDLQYRVISVNNSEWNVIKNQFNDSIKNNKKIYKYVEEDQILEKRTSKKKPITAIDKMFDEIVQYK